MKVRTTAISGDPGFEPVATEHRVQLELLSALQHALEQAWAPAQVEAILEQLIAYTNTHFMSEQLLMRLYAYPYYESHSQDHDRLMEQAQELHGRYRAGDVEALRQTSAALEDWLMEHIQGLDHGLEDYLRRHAPPGARH